MSHIIFGVGSPSDLAAFEKKYCSLGNKTIGNYLDEKGIKHLEEPLKLSCHRTLDRVVSYARELENHAQKTDEPIITILFGGLSFALPGIFSSQTSTIPVIGVPAYAETASGGLDSATAVYNLPPGTVVGGAPQHSKYKTSLDKAVLIAEKMLNIDINYVRLTSMLSEETKELKELFDQPLFTTNYFKHEILLSDFENNKAFSFLDQMLYLALRSKNQQAQNLAEFIDTLSALSSTSNTLYFGNPQNATLFLARTLALSSKELKEKLRKYHKQKRAETEKKYGPKIDIGKLLR